ncbi:unnamed protein product [Schistosoma guineensis]|nr:unnamed protein product [Schistosoma guineensis]
MNTGPFSLLNLYISTKCSPLYQVLKHRHFYRLPTIVIFLDRQHLTSLAEVLRQSVIERRINEVISSVQVFYTTGRVRAYGELSSEVVTSNGFRQGCPLSPLLFNFVIDMLLEITLSSSDVSEIDLPGDSLVDLEYTHDIVLFGEKADEIQSFDHPKQQCKDVCGGVFSVHMLNVSSG